MPGANISDRARIRELNDRFRKTLDPALGRFMVTAGVNALPGNVRALAVQKVVAFDEFDADNDPHGEHDFGSFDLMGQKFFWKIDYYDSTLEAGSPDPTDTTKTVRVLTLMLAIEY